MSKTVLITGAGGDLGRELSVEFANKGYDLVLVSRTLSKLKETEKRVKKNVVISSILDVTDLKKIKNLKKDLDRRKIKVDILVNNAGLGVFGKTSEIEVEQIEKMINVNYLGAVYLTKVFMEGHKSKNKTIVFINTMASRILIPKFGVYGSTKAALAFFGKALQKENDSISVVNVYLGPLKTEFWKRTEFSKRRFGFADVKTISKQIVNAVIKKEKTVILPSWWNIILMANKLSQTGVYWLYKKFMRN